MTTATITFQDGTHITADKNGDCYITTIKPDLPATLGAVLIESEEGTKEYKDAQLVECASVDGRYWFAFIETPEDVKLHRRIDELENINYMLEECILEISEIIYA